MVLLLWLTGVCASLQAQIQVSLSTDRNEYLLYEVLDVTVKVANQSGEVLDMARMAQSEPWIDFVISTPENEEISHTDRPWSPPRFALIPGEVRSLTFNLTPNFQIREAGRYRVKAVVTQVGRRYSSRTINFSVIQGATIWKQNFLAPPGVNDVKRELRPRLYSLLVHRNNDRNVLYLRIQNPEAGWVFCTTPLGEAVNYGEPRARIDKHGDCHIFHQSGTRIFTYTRFSVMGKRLTTRFFSNISSPPNMIVDDNGNTEVIGGEELFVDENQRQSVIPTPPLGNPPGK